MIWTATSIIINIYINHNNYLVMYIYTYMWSIVVQPTYGSLAKICPLLAPTTIFEVEVAATSEQQTGVTTN